MNRLIGTISFYSQGWGFIACPDLQQDIFFHRTQLPVADQRRRDLAERPVTFALGQREGKPMAVDIRFIVPAENGGVL